MKQTLTQRVAKLESAINRIETHQVRLSPTSNRRIEAIKYWRQRTGEGLIETKKIVDILSEGGFIR